jgi:hypothetical protein
MAEGLSSHSFPHAFSRLDVQIVGEDDVDVCGDESSCENVQANEKTPAPKSHASNFLRG